MTDFLSPLPKPCQRLGWKPSTGVTVQVLRPQDLNSYQIFSRNPRGWLAASLDPEQVREFFEARERHSINPVVIHAPYLINLAAPDPVMWKRSVSAFRNEVKRAVGLGLVDKVVTSGSVLSAAIKAALKLRNDELRELQNGYI